MASNQFGRLFRITTWGESHGKAMGVVIDGCPAGLTLSEEDIQRALSRRRPGQGPYTSPRNEPDSAEILSGVFEKQTTGAPISILIPNCDVDSKPYEETKDLLRPGHANFTYLEKYGHFDYRGGGRASARETVCRVAAGAVAEKLLMEFGIEVAAFLKEVAGISAFESSLSEIDSLMEQTWNSPIFCPDGEAEREMRRAIEAAKETGDSVGGVVELRAEGLSVGLGDPVYEKIEANLAKALMSIPASKGVEFGAGFGAAQMRGSEHNDLFERNIEGTVITRTNHSGGTLGGITNGMPLIARCAFKPTSSIQKRQATLDENGQRAEFSLPRESKHDPCVAIRAVPVVKAMGALVLADALLSQRLATLFQREHLPL